MSLSPNQDVPITIKISRESSTNASAGSNKQSTTNRCLLTEKKNVNSNSSSLKGSLNDRSNNSSLKFSSVKSDKSSKSKNSDNPLNLNEMTLGMHLNTVEEIIKESGIFMGDEDLIPDQQIEDTSFQVSFKTVCLISVFTYTN